jgi:hypothetical protein
MLRLVGLFFVMACAPRSQDTAGVGAEGKMDPSDPRCVVDPMYLACEATCVAQRDMLLKQAEDEKAACHATMEATSQDGYDACDDDCPDDGSGDGSGTSSGSGGGSGTGSSSGSGSGSGTGSSSGSTREACYDAVDAKYDADQATCDRAYTTGVWQAEWVYGQWIQMCGPKLCANLDY